MILTYPDTRTTRAMSEPLRTRLGQTVPTPFQPSRPVRKVAHYHSSPVNDSLPAPAQVKTIPDQTSQRDDPPPKLILSKHRSDSICNTVMSRNRFNSLHLTISTSSRIPPPTPSCTMPTCRISTATSVVFTSRPPLVLPSSQIGSTMIRLLVAGVKSLQSFHLNTALLPKRERRDTFIGSLMGNQLGPCTLTPLDPTQGLRLAVVSSLRSPCTW